MSISQEMPQPSVTEIRLKITYLKFHSNLPGANELMWLLIQALLYATKRGPVDRSYVMTIIPSFELKELWVTEVRPVMFNIWISGACVWHCHKPFSQWEHSFQMQAVFPLAEQLDPCVSSYLWTPMGLQGFTYPNIFTYSKCPIFAYWTIDYIYHLNKILAKSSSPMGCFTWIWLLGNGICRALVCANSSKLQGVRNEVPSIALNLQHDID